jgi:hypothetical protein
MIGRKTYSRGSALPRRLMVRHRILIPFIEVRILAGHPSAISNIFILHRCWRSMGILEPQELGIASERSWDLNLEISLD